MASQPTESKRAYQRKMEAHLEKLQAQMNELKAKADQAKADAKIQYHDKLIALNQKHETMQTKLHELKNASEDAWQELRVGAEAALYELQNAFNNALAQFK